MKLNKKIKLRFKYCYIIFLILFFSCQYVIADIHGKVVKIIDGDTVDILANKAIIKVRLVDIDAPEKDQPFGKESKESLHNMIFNQQVIVIEKGKDRYNRVLGEIFKKDNTNVNAIQVSNGMAWAYRYRGKATNPIMLDLENKAKEKHYGLWSDLNGEIIEPRKWRKDKNNSLKNKNNEQSFMLIK